MYKNYVNSRKKSKLLEMKKITKIYTTGNYYKRSVSALKWSYWKLNNFKHIYTRMYVCVGRQVKSDANISVSELNIFGAKFFDRVNILLPPTFIFLHEQI